MVICLEQGADLHMAQLMPLPLTVACFSKIKIGFTFLIPAHPGSPGKWSVKRVCMCVCVCVCVSVYRPNCLFGRIDHKSLINALSADESTFTKLSVILAASLTMVNSHCTDTQ